MSLFAETVVSHCYFSASIAVMEHKVRYARERLDLSSLVGAFHEVWCPDASRAGMQGSGRSKASLDGKVDSPHYGGYTTRAV